MRSISLLAAAVAVALVSAKAEEGPTAIQAGDVGKKIVILGNLGRPVGEKLVIRGEKVKDRIFDRQDRFAVDSVNDEKLPKPTVISVPKISKWPIGTKAELRGFEFGRLKFTSIEEGNFHGASDPRFVLRQELGVYFNAREVLDQKNLKLGPGENEGF